MNKKTIASTVLFLIYGISTVLFAQDIRLLKKNWAIQSSAKITAAGSGISRVGFSNKGWYPATMPSTILETLVKDGVCKDPYYGDNLTKIEGYFPVISGMYLYDMPKDSPFSVPWWYRTEFELAEGNGFVWLKFNSINYKANIWLNGSLIADTTEIEGAHRVYELDVTGEVIRGGKNCLSLEIVPPVHATDLSIRWMQGSRMVPDKDAGIWYNIKIIRNGKLKIRYPHIITSLPLPDTTMANVTITADIYNNSTKQVKGKLFGNILPVNNLAEGGTSAGGNDTYAFDEKIDLKPHETKRVKICLEMNHPSLWWPNMAGKQNLYDLYLQVKDENGNLTDRNITRFGVREVSSTLDDFFPGVDQKLVRVFQVNGRNIFVKGGNWTQTLTMEENPERDEAEVKHMINMHFNAIRTEGFWGSDHFYDLCDKYGIMIFDGFNCCSIWERWDVWIDHTYDIAGKSFRDLVIRKRNHPCFVNWFLASDTHVPFRAEKLYVNILREYDNTRPYESNAMYNTTPFCGCTGVDHDPYPDTYIYLPPTTWYGLRKKDEHGNYGPYEFLEFNTEVGPGGEQIPPMESMRAMMSKEDLWPINKKWEIRQSSDAFSIRATHAFFARYGEPSDLESYTVKAQAFQKEAYRAMVEAYRKNKYKASGLLIYRVNAGWPSLCYFLYDFYLRPDGAYSAVQQAYEPFHVQYSYDDSTVVVVNDLNKAFHNLKVSAKVLNLDMTEKRSKTTTLDIGKDTVKTAFTLPLDIEGLSDVYFVRLDMEDGEGKQLSTNFYWLSVKYDTIADFRALMDLPTADLNASAEYKANGKSSIITVKLTNPTDRLAFFLNPKILKGLHGEELLPSYWSARYFSLLPGETREVKVIFDKAKLEEEQPYIMLEGWNMYPVELSLPGNEVVTPSFAYGKLKMIKKIKAGQGFDLSVAVKNTAGSGTALLKAQQYLYVDGHPVSCKRVALAPGETKFLSWRGLKIDKKGNHIIGVGSMKPVRITIK